MVNHAERVATRTAGTSRARVLVVDDDAEVRRIVVRLIELEGYEAGEAASAAEVHRALSSAAYDLVLLDVMLDTDDGLEVLSTIRGASDIPVILLTARTGETDRVMGLRLGADDYVAKPFSGPELAARMFSVLRRSHRAKPTNGTLAFDNLSIDTRSREVVVADQVVETTLKEFDLLAFLATSPRQVFTREQLLDQVWGSSSAWQDDGTVTEHVRRIRQKLELAGAKRDYIRTIRGVGYSFEP